MFGQNRRFFNAADSVFAIAQPEAKGAESGIGPLETDFDEICAKTLAARGDDDFLDAALAEKIRLPDKQEPADF